LFYPVTLNIEGIRDFPVVIWAALLFNRLGLPLSVLLIALIASSGTAHIRRALSLGKTTITPCYRWELGVGTGIQMICYEDGNLHFQDLFLL
jgi:hypothetical protein